MKVENTGRARIAYRPLDGILLFDKPLGLSSNIALQKVRRLFRAAKAGHTGTLDPLATGLLPICFGEATKFTGTLLDADKSYRALLRLGQVTTTGDAEGEVIAEYPVEVDEVRVLQVLPQFTGEIEQLPPMYSAIKHAGKPLYEYVRKGKTVERTPRRVTIYELKLDRFAGIELEITVRCSKGTYVRTLAEDIGQALGCGAHLKGLRRLSIGDFRLEQAHGWEQLESMDEAVREACLLPLDCLLQDLPMLELADEQVRRIAQGQRLAVDGASSDGRMRLYGSQGFLGTAVLTGHILQPERLLSQVAKNAARSSN